MDNLLKDVARIVATMLVQIDPSAQQGVIEHQLMMFYHAGQAQAPNTARTQQLEILLKRAAVYVVAHANPEFELPRDRGFAQDLMNDINGALDGR